MGDFWQPTAEMYQQLFSKPKMTEKLLSRPPFRYIHDIFTATMEATGFGVGLYGEDELNAKSIKDKDSKINFLEKLIALVQLAMGEEIGVRSSKIVAGQEAEQTNIFLQSLYTVATSGVDSGPIVAQIVGGDEGGDSAQEEDDGAAAAEEEARRQAEAEELKKQKRAAKKKAMEEERLRKQQEEEEERMRAEQEAQERADRERAQAEANKRKAQQKKKREEPQEAPSHNPNIIEDEEEDEDPQNFIQQEDDDVHGGIDMNDVDPESKFGRQAMAQLRAQEEEDEANRDNNDTGGGGIKMKNIRGRRGKKKAGGVERSEPQKKSLQNEVPKRTFGGYSEDDIEYMKKSIQELCQATNPLGKSIDFVTEDVDSMVKEYEHWKLDYAESQTKLEEQQRITEQTIQPLQDVTLAQLEERIREEKSKIQSIRSQIIRNDNVIQNLLQSVISSG